MIWLVAICVTLVWNAPKDEPSLTDYVLRSGTNVVWTGTATNAEVEAESGKVYDFSLTARNNAMESEPITLRVMVIRTYIQSSPDLTNWTVVDTNWMITTNFPAQRYFRAVLGISQTNEGKYGIRRNQ